MPIAFIDPVFSSGVYLAMNSAFVGAEVVAATLDQPAQAAAERRRFERRCARGRASSPGSSSASPTRPCASSSCIRQNPLRVKEALMSLLAGDIYGKTPIWRSLRVLKALYFVVSRRPSAPHLAALAAAAGATSATSGRSPAKTSSKAK